MADESSKSVDITNTEQYVKVRASYLRTKQELAVAQTKILELEKARDAALSEAATVKSKYDENKLTTENADLRGQVRTLSHRRVFDRLAKDRGVPDDSLDLVFQASGYRPENDDVDESALGKMLDDLKNMRGISRLFNGEPETPSPAPGRGQGGRDQTGAKWRVTRAQNSDPIWCMQNDEKRAEAIANGTFELID